MVETQLCKLRGTSDIYTNYRLLVENAGENVVDMKRCISFSTIEEYDTIVFVILHVLFAAVLLCASTSCLFRIL